MNAMAAPIRMNVKIGMPIGRSELTSVPPPFHAKNPMAILPSADPQQEYVSGDAEYKFAQYLRTLPQYIDDLTRELGDDIYERMQTDAKVYSSLEVLKLSVLEGGVRLSPRIDDVKDPRYALSQSIFKFCQKNIEGLDRPFEQFCYEMLDGMATGCRVAEKIMSVGKGEDGNAVLNLKMLKIKPRRTTAFVVDAFRNVLGLASLIPGRTFTIYYGTNMHIENGPPPESILPREKFAVFTHNPKDSDPRGTSILRAAYDPWWSKTQLKGQFLRYLSLFAVPSIWGTTGEHANASPAEDGNGNTGGLINPKSLSPEQQMVNALKNLRNGSVAAFPFGAQVQMLSPANNESLFINAFEFFNKEIVTAILAQTLATEEGEHMSRAAQQGHRDIFDIVMANVRRQLSMMIEYDILCSLIEYNFGEAEARELCPTVSFGAGGPKEDISLIASAVSTLIGCGFLTADQLPYFDKKIGVPARQGKSLYEMNLKNTEKQGNAPPQAPPPPTDKATPATASFSAKITRADIEKAKLTLRVYGGTTA